MAKILVVDDEPNIRNLCYQFLRKDGHQVMTAARGSQLLAMLLSEKPDLIIMDLRIPGEEGLSLLKKIRDKAGNKIPVIVFSAYVSQDIEKQAYEAGAAEVVHKTIPMSELVDKANRILSARNLSAGSLPPLKERKTLLLVDDDPQIIKLLETYFTGKGFKTISAHDGEEAIEFVKDLHPAVVLMDMGLPGMDGMLTLIRMREIDPNLGIIIMTGMQDDALAKEAIEKGAYHYILKPIDMQYLELVVLSRIQIALQKKAESSNP